MDTKLGVADLGRDIEAALERVRGGGKVVIERNGEPSAVIVPVVPKPGVTRGELAEAMRHLPPLDDDFADDLAAIRAAQQPVRSPVWLD